MPSDVLKYPSWYYTPQELRIQLTQKQINAEYSRLRSIAMKRLKRMSESEFRTSQLYLQNKSAFPSIREEKGRNIEYRLTAVARFLEAGSTLSELREKRDEIIETLNRHGYKFVNRQNFNRFTDFMDEYRTRKLNRLYDSERAAQLFNISEEKNIPEDILFSDFKQYTENLDKLESMKPFRNKNKVSSTMIRRRAKS